ncbi:MAG: ABC transporter substrate-binding protein [Patescibacteria group bacterium]
MEKQKGLWIGVAVVAVLLIAFALSRQGGQQQEKQVGTEPTQPSQQEQPKSGNPIIIGSILPLTGDGAAYGEPDREIMQMAADEINASGGVNGSKLEIIFEDSKCSGKDAANAIQKLISIDKVQAVVGAACSSEALAAFPIAEKNKIAFLSNAASSPDLTNASPYFFRDYPSDASQGKILAQVALEKGWKNMAFMQEKKDYPLGIYKAFGVEFEKGGGSIIKEEFASDAVDFRTQLKKLQVAKPDALFISAQTPASGERVLKQLKELGWTVQLFISDAMSGDTELMKRHAAQLEGTLAAEFGVDEQNPKFQHLLDAYKTQYKKDAPFQSYAQTEYDSVYLIVDGLKAVGNNGEKLAAWSRTVKDWDGASGKVTIEATGDRAGGHVAKIVKNGKVELLK